MDDLPHPATTPQPTSSSLVERLVMALALTFAFWVLQSIAIALTAGIAHATGIATVDLRQLAKRADTAPILLVLAVADLATAVLVAFGVWASTRSLAALALSRRGAVLSFVYALPLLMLGVVLPAFANYASHHRFAAPGVDATLAATFVLLGIAVAIVEELVFRGVLMTMLGVERQPWLAITVSAVIFAALHAAGPGSPQSVFNNMVQVTGLVAIPFACIRAVSGSVVGLIAAHALIDTTSVLELGGFHLPAPPSQAETLMQEALAFVVASGYLIWAYVRIRRARAAQALSGIDFVS